MSAQILFDSPCASHSAKAFPRIREPERRVAALMDQVIEAKQGVVQKALDGRVNISEAVLIGGDFFSMGYLAFQGAQIVKPSLAALPAIGLATLGCGVIAGAINIGVAIISLKECYQAAKNGDTKLALRLGLDFFGLLGVGTIMILASLAIRVSALAGVTAFFGTHAWLLPLLFFVISIPLILEVGTRIYNIQSGKDLAAQLNGNLDELVNGKDEHNPFHLQPLVELAKEENDPLVIYNSLAGKIEKLQSDMGVEAAIATFELMKKKLLKEASEEQESKVREKVKEWNRAQKVRMFQQLLYAAAFGVSMGALSPKLNTAAVNGAETFAMAAANAIPLGMDIYWPFKRNTLIVVPHVMKTEEDPNRTFVP